MNTAEIRSTLPSQKITHEQDIHLKAHPPKDPVEEFEIVDETPSWFTANSKTMESTTEHDKISQNYTIIASSKKSENQQAKQTTPDKTGDKAGSKPLDPISSTLAMEKLYVPKLTDYLQVLSTPEEKEKLILGALLQYGEYLIKYNLLRHTVDEAYGVVNGKVKINCGIAVGATTLHLCSRLVDKNTKNITYKSTGVPGTDLENDFAKIMIMLTLATLLSNEYEIIPFGRICWFGCKVFPQNGENLTNFSRVHFIFVRHKSTGEIFGYPLGYYSDVLIEFDKEVPLATPHKGETYKILNHVLKLSRELAKGFSRYAALSVDLHNMQEDLRSKQPFVVGLRNKKKLCMIQLNHLPNDAKVVGFRVDRNQFPYLQQDAEFGDQLDQCFMQALQHLANRSSKED